MVSRLVILDPMAQPGLDKFAQYLPEDFEIATSRSREAADQIEAITGATFVITADVPVTAAMMEAGAASGLKAVQKWGVGYDNIDLESARRLGVRVLRTTGSNAVAVAETALALILGLQRNIIPGHVGLQKGLWLKRSLSETSMRLTGKTVGLVGLGYIGKQLARLLRGFDCDVIYTKRTPISAEEARELRARLVTLDELIETSDVISLHCALTEETANMINRESIARMKKGSILVNTARGGLVNEEDLAEAVESGHLRGAAVDVFPVEPIAPDHRFVGVERITITPHIGAIAADTYATNVQRMVHNLACVAAGTEPPELDVLV
ncbi:NAD(P)-dependent oxidoreductase [Gluconacetobacter tumulisoli]|uniref:3-phosphoglycerate dehydrogenase n=1 Tax=Gluconacetobacter tumulisoli TaxID=1286189 RepID=A0A7W4PNN1_9PROT|nr:2-hydroxyacid dehydrogenase [Gluconacetobacter tumulisoli]MBB2202779.1 3-phosphoglycerate dehydrogenase [Gluconacetobacter tumulisoli]